MVSKVNLGKSGHGRKGKKLRKIEHYRKSKWGESNRKQINLPAEWLENGHEERGHGSFLEKTGHDYVAEICVTMLMGSMKGYLEKWKHGYREKFM